MRPQKCRDGDARDGGHHDGAELVLRGLRHGIVTGHAGEFQHARFVQDQDGVVHHDADHHDRAEHADHGERGVREEDDEEEADESERHGEHDEDKDGHNKGQK